MSDEHLSDEELEQQMRAALQDPIPDDLIGISEGLFTWRTIDAELAELELSDESVGVRGEDSATLTFVVDDQVIEAELQTDPRQLVVDLGGSWAAGIRLVTPSGGELVAGIDEFGVASFADPPSGPLQLVIERARRRSCQDQVDHFVGRTCYFRAASST